MPTASIDALLQERAQLKQRADNHESRAKAELSTALRKLRNRIYDRRHPRPAAKKRRFFLCERIRRMEQRLAALQVVPDATYVSMSCTAADVRHKLSAKIERDTQELARLQLAQLCATSVCVKQ